MINRLWYDIFHIIPHINPRGADMGVGLIWGMIRKMSYNNLYVSNFFKFSPRRFEPYCYTHIVNCIVSPTRSRYAALVILRINTWALEKDFVFWYFQSWQLYKNVYFDIFRDGSYSKMCILIFSELVAIQKNVFWYFQSWQPYKNMYFDIFRAGSHTKTCILIFSELAAIQKHVFWYFQS